MLEVVLDQKFPSRHPSYDFLRTPRQKSIMQRLVESKNTLLEQEKEDLTETVNTLKTSVKADPGNEACTKPQSLTV